MMSQNQKERKKTFLVKYGDIHGQIRVNIEVNFEWRGSQRNTKPCYIIVLKFQNNGTFPAERHLRAGVS